MDRTDVSPQEPQPTLPPKRQPPPGACDTHIHASDGTARFPILRKTHPPLHAPWAIQKTMLQSTGLERGVAVQLMAYGDDNSAMIELLQAASGQIRGVAEVDATASDDALARLHGAGVRGLRFYLEPPKPLPGIEIGGAGLSDLEQLAPRMKALGWSAEISAGCDLIVELAPRFRALGVPVVFEHMGGCLAKRGVADPAVQRVVDLMRDGAFWMKLTICAMSDLFPDYADLRPIHDAFIAVAPKRMLWGSNWPHAMMGPRTPDSGHLLDIFDEWIGGDETLRRTILSDNPAGLFDFAP